MTFGSDIIVLFIALLCHMNLSTPISFPNIETRLGYKDKVVMLGSCFSENIGSWLQDLRFHVAYNTTGISYNPMSISRHIDMALDSERLTTDTLIENQGQTAHFDFHSMFNSENAETCISNINASLEKLHMELRECNVLVLTFGTAIVFENLDTGQVVNNNQKQPANQFRKRYLDEKEMVGAVSGSLQDLRKLNPDLRILLTVSPIRHLRHGAAENQRSKARLIRLCEMLCDEIPPCSYLPVYEYVMDELRDYRFYRHDDMIHLNELGLDLIKEKILRHLIDPKALPLMERVEKWKQMKTHRVMQLNTNAAKSFQDKLEAETQAIETLLPLK